MSTHALYLVRMDVAHDHEAKFNEVYDREHLPNLRGVPGVRRASRYRQSSPTDPRWGVLLNAGRRSLTLWWLIVFPGAAIFLAVLAYNLIGEGLQEATDPRLREAGK